MRFHPKILRSSGGFKGSLDLGMSGTSLPCCEDEVITIDETKTWFAKTESLALQRLADPEFLQHKDGGWVPIFLEISCVVGSQVAGTGKMTECIACGTDPNDFGSSVQTVWLQKWILSTI